MTDTEAGTDTLSSTPLSSAEWTPHLGAWPDGTGVRFRVWAPDAGSAAVRLEASSASEHPLDASGEGYLEGWIDGVAAGTRYRYVLRRGDGAAESYPDPASRYQPEGVHGPSEVIDPAGFDWTDEGWRGIDLMTGHASTYELHIGTLTPEGTFASATLALEEIASLGVSAVQLMPLADFAGERGWGYDGVQPFAPARCYGRPDDLRAFVDRAHALGIGVILDVVYNHFGPDGSYQRAFAGAYFTERHQSPWGAGINLDGPGSQQVRDYFIESALHWMHEYHIDGFRLDATDTLVDDSPEHFLAEYRRRLHAAAPPEKHIAIIAEDARNFVTIVQRPEEGGYAFDGVLADDFHHEIRTILAGDRQGYYQDFHASTRELTAILKQGWLYTGQHSDHLGRPRGSDPAGVPLPRFVVCIQNHDQVGNRAFGDRLTDSAALPAYRAASVLLLTAAHTPMLFMGQEWAASTPFQFFTDHHEELGRLVTEGRRNEFKAWDTFSSDDVPDPQSEATFLRSKLDWPEREVEPHASTLQLYRALLSLRRTEMAFDWSERAGQHAHALGDEAVALCRDGGGAATLVIARLRGEGDLLIEHNADLVAPRGTRWELALTTEDEGLATDPMPIEVDLGEPESPPSVRFRRAGAIVLRAIPIS